MSLPRIGDRMGSSGGSNEGLPSGYTRLIYLQSTGTQYIKTDFFVPADGLYLWADVQFVGSNIFTSGNEIFFDYTNKGNGSVNFGGGNNQIYDLFNWWGNYSGGGPYHIGSSFKVVNGRNIYEVKDLTVTYGPHQLSIVDQGLGVESEVPFLIFGGYKSGTEEVNPFGRWNMRIYEMKLGLRDGTIVRHLVPALDNDGRPCLHDLISGQSFYNSGTGTFSYSIIPDKLPELPDKNFTPVNYLIFTGEQYIKTGIYATNETGAKIKASVDNTPSHLLHCRSLTAGQGVDNSFGIPFTTNDFLKIYYSFGKSFEISKVTATGMPHESSLNFKNDSSATWDNEIISTFNREDYLPENYCKNPLVLGSFVNDQVYPYAAYNLKGAVFYAIITQGSEVVRDFVPCLDKDGIPCFYDKVSETAFYNDGGTSQNFIWG